MTETLKKEMVERLHAFLAEAKEQNIPLGAVCLSDENGIIECDHLAVANYRNIYSHSKSFTSLMVGVAIDEGKLHMEDRMVDILGRYMDEEQKEMFKEVRLIDLMTMRSGQGGGVLMELERRTGEGHLDYLDWALHQKLVEKPGTHFAYSNGDTFLASMMVSEVYHMPFIEICYQKIFQPMGCIYPVWEMDLKGNVIAASSIFFPVEDMNKFGILLLNDGVWNGKRIVSHEYVQAMRDTLVDTDNWGYGDYSLQIWHNPHPYEKVLRADGWCGQFTFIDFDRKFAFSTQRGEDDLVDNLLRLIEKYFFPQ